MAAKKAKAAKKKRAKKKAKRKEARRQLVSVPVQQLPQQPEPQGMLESVKTLARNGLKAAEDIVGWTVDAATWPTRLAIEGFKSASANAQKKSEPTAAAS